MEIYVSFQARNWSVWNEVATKRITSVGPEKGFHQISKILPVYLYHKNVSWCFPWRICTQGDFPLKSRGGGWGGGGLTRRKPSLLKSLYWGMALPRYIIGCTTSKNFPQWQSCSHAPGHNPTNSQGQEQCSCQWIIHSEANQEQEQQSSQGAGAGTIESQEKLELHPSEVSKHIYRTGAGAALLQVNNSQWA